MQSIQHVPFFPLNLILIPGEQCSMHIFEPKYKQLLTDCLKGNKKFAIPFFGRENQMKIGSLVRIAEVDKYYEDDRADIIIEGVENFHLLAYEQILKDKLYAGGSIMILDKFQNQETSFETQELFAQYLNLSQQQRTELYQVKNYSITDMASDLNFSIKQKIKYISFKSFSRKQQFIIEQLKFLTFLLQQEQRTQNNFYLN